MPIEYLVVCTASLPNRPRAWGEPFGPVSIALLSPDDRVRLQLEARMSGISVCEVVSFSARASAGHLAFQFATAVAKMASGVVFDEESLDEPVADYRGYPSLLLESGIESIWTATIDSERRTEDLRARREREAWGPLVPDEENDWSDSLG